MATLYFQKQITLETAMLRSSSPDELQEIITRGAGYSQQARLSHRQAGKKVTRFAICKEVAYASFYVHREGREGRQETGKSVSPKTSRRSEAQLRRERLSEITIKEKGKEFLSCRPSVLGKVPVKDIAIFFRQFSVMIDAGLPLVQCLEILAANQENVAFQKDTARSARLRRPAGSHAALGQERLAPAGRRQPRWLCPAVSSRRAQPRPAVP